MTLTVTDAVTRQQYRVLLVEDNPIDVEVLRVRLSASKTADYFVIECPTLEDCEKALATEQPDVVLLDLSLPDAHDMHAIARVAELRPELPIVILTGSEEEDLALRALEAGSEDFLVKRLMDTASLEKSIKYSIARKQVHELQLRLHFSEEVSTRTIHSERLAALGELAAGVAHELNQPLNAIKLIAQSILRYDPETEKLHEEVREVLSLVKTMADTIDQLRLFSRDREVETAPIDVNDLVEGTLRLVGQEIRDRGISMTTKLSSGLGAVNGHSVRLGQCLLNLILNARDSLDECERDDKSIEIATTAKLGALVAAKRAVLIEVRDNGPGVLPHARGRIFEPFFTTKAPGRGTGLGLAIAAKIVGQHDGWIEEERADTGETVFRIILPESSAGPG